MMRKISIWLTLSIILLSSACTQKDKGKTSTVAGREKSDTLAIAEEKLVALPDTAFESVKLINWTTEIHDTLTPGELDNLQDVYIATPGIFLFRGNAYRDGDMKGRVKGRPSEIVKDWEFKTVIDNRTEGIGQAWGGGSGWTGQPVYVEWPDSLIKKYVSQGNVSGDFSGKEIIVGSLSSNLYFIDFETGETSRNPISTGNPIKGSIMLDPALNGNIYVGHGVPNQRPFGAVLVNLDSHSIADVAGEDIKAPRRWGAYDSNALRRGQFVFRPGENGVIYKYIVSPGKEHLHSRMSYRASGTGPGVESSMSSYRNYGYTADNHGYIVCINLDTMKPVWVYNLGDDTDSTPVIAEEDGKPYVYVGSEIDRTSRGYAKYVKLDGLTGEPVWEKTYPGRRFDLDGKHFDGGFYSSSLMGQGNAKDLIFVNVVENLKGQNGKFIAMSRKTGDIVYEVPLKHYAWSSPVGFLNEGEEMFILTADCIGTMYLIDAKDGTIIDSKPVGANFESSPVVAGNSAVVGSRGDTIYKVSVK